MPTKHIVHLEKKSGWLPQSLVFHTCCTKDHAWEIGSLFLDYKYRPIQRKILKCAGKFSLYIHCGKCGWLPGKQIFCPTLYPVLRTRFILIIVSITAHSTKNNFISNQLQSSTLVLYATKIYADGYRTKALDSCC